MIPKGTRLLARREDKGSSRSRLLQVGIPWSVEEFLGCAVQAEHPFDSDELLDTDVSRAVASIATAGIQATAKHREECLAYYRGRAQQLDKEESVLRASLPGDVREILADKKLLLFREMCADAEVGDNQLFFDMCNGFPIVGEQSPSGVFQHKSAPPRISLKHS